jgi:hypothetical protein
VNRPLLAVVVALLAPACAVDLVDLAPFPCAADSTCPESLMCAVGASRDAVGICLDSCASSGECQDGSSCGPAAGGNACLPECQPFGYDCELGTTCRLSPLAGDQGFFATCSVIGDGERLASCETSIDCPANTSCMARGAEPLACRPNCDADHPCRRGMTCEPLLPSSAGVCFDSN